MKLPFFSPEPHPPVPPATIEPPWQTLVLICEKCKGARKGPTSREIRKGIKATIGKHKSLRIIEVDCLGVCPDDAVTVCTARSRSAAEVQLIATQAELESFARTLAP